ncbi:pol polyprotein [Striga asiatica]|uniref:Pol polyprotein n=1 Tax=Striga asiatica TaxID=4170 RepID=A0A5A7R909_STRAF|nr:pol polyprotein [Striga asiatica]
MKRVRLEWVGGKGPCPFVMEKNRSTTRSVETCQLEDSTRAEGTRAHPGDRSKRTYAEGRAHGTSPGLLFHVHRIMVDTGAYSSILYWTAFLKMGIDRRSRPNGRVIMETFKVVKMNSEYNTILGRTTLYKLKVVVSIFHYSIKFLIKNGVGVHYGNQRVARECIVAIPSLEIHLVMTANGVQNPMARPNDESKEPTEQDIPTPTEHLADNSVTKGREAIEGSDENECLSPVRPIIVDEPQSDEGRDNEATLDEEDQTADRGRPLGMEPIVEKDELHSRDPLKGKKVDRAKPREDTETIYLDEPYYVFAWTHEDMMGIDPNLACHSLKIDRAYKPMIQKRGSWGRIDRRSLKGVTSTAINAVIIQEEDSNQHPIYYVSNALHYAEVCYPSIGKLIFALVTASRKLRLFLEHQITVLSTYPIRQILHRPDTSGRMIKWAVKLGQYNIQYRPRTTINGQALFDFITEFTTGAEPIQNMETWEMYIDGLVTSDEFRGGVVIVSPQKKLYCHSVRVFVLSHQQRIQIRGTLIQTRFSRVDEHHQSEGLFRFDVVSEADLRRIRDKGIPIDPVLELGVQENAEGKHSVGAYSPN